MAAASRPDAVRCYLRLLVLASGLLALSGCVVGDGIAHVVKLAAGSDSDKPAAATTAVPPASGQPAAATADDPMPAPVPASAPRDSIKVEELKP